MKRIQPTAWIMWITVTNYALYMYSSCSFFISLYFYLYKGGYKSCLILMDKYDQ